MYNEGVIKCLKTVMSVFLKIYTKIEFFKIKTHNLKTRKF
jgi:hypothetical protein